MKGTPKTTRIAFKDTGVWDYRLPILIGLSSSPSLLDYAALFAQF
jgi:hypothetical protein